MNIVFHKGLTLEKWQAMTQQKRLLNIFSELTRAKNWMKEGHEEWKRDALERAFELMDMTLEVWPKENNLREFLRFREVIGEFYLGIRKEAADFQGLLKVFLELEPSIHNLGLEI